MNHNSWACDFLQLYDAWVPSSFVFFFFDVNTKREVRVAVAHAPTEDWTPQQLRKVTPFGMRPQVPIGEGDSLSFSSRRRTN